MTPNQRQDLVNAGFTHKGLKDVDFILDRLPKSKHDEFVKSMVEHEARVLVRIGYERPMAKAMSEIIRDAVKVH